MYRILRIINRFNLGGPSYNVAYLTRFLAPEFETMLVGGEKDDTEASSDFIFQRYGITPTVLPGMKRSILPYNDLMAYRKIKQLIKTLKPHIVHTHASKAGFLGRMAAFSCGVPVTVHTFHGHIFHSYFGSWQTSLYKNIEQYLASRTTALIALSEKQKEELSSINHIAPAHKFHVIPLGFDLDRFNTDQPVKRKQFRTRYGFAENEVVIGIIGRLVPVKNHDLFLEAFRKAKDKSGAPLRACIVGDGELRLHLADKCKALHLSYSMPENENPSADVVFTSWIKEVDIALAGLDILALSSLNEGTPVSLIEAQAAGKPIVSTRTGGIENVVIPDVTALLSAPNNMQALADNLYRLASDRQLRTALSAQGMKFVNERFNYKILVENTRKLYMELLERNKVAEG